MTTKQVLEQVAVFLGKEDLLACPYFTNSEEEINDADAKELDMLLRCLNLIVGEIATDYLPIYKSKEVVFINNQLRLTDIDENIYQLAKIEDEFACPVRFKIYDNMIHANVKNAKVFYTSFATKCTLEGEVENFNNLMSPRVLAYGTAMEYSFISSLFDDASIWESRYKNALLVLSNKKYNKVMPKRRWL